MRAIVLVAVMAIFIPVLEAGGQPVSASTLSKMELRQACPL